MRIFLPFAMVFACSALFGQGYMLTDGTGYRYSVGAADVPAEWKSAEFDDSQWLLGRKTIGFGDDDDTTVIEQFTSVFLRFPFQVNSLDSVREAVIAADYDDGFVAYINGHEVLRKFMGAEGSPVTYSQLADRSRNAVSDEYNMNRYGYYLDTALLRSSLRVGSNVLAVEVHNDSIAGSDLSFSCQMYNRTATQFSPYDPAWCAIKRINLDSTRLPIVVISTLSERGNYGERQPIDFKVIYRNGAFNKLTDPATVYKDHATYEIRGQSSSDWAKKSYNIELKDQLGATQDSPLLGMASHNDWVLAANYTDRSLIRNMLTYTLARRSNTTAPDSRFVELVMDGDYMGVYQLIAKPRRDKNRINVEKQEPFQTEHITGGYIFKFDKPGNTYEAFKSLSGISLFAVYPEYREMSSEQKTYIKAYWDSIFVSQQDKYLLDPVRGYRNFIDVDSYLDFTIFNELCRNSDGFRFSTYMYKPANGKMHFGPLWDFDLTYGNSSAQGGSSTSGWLHSQGTNNVSMQKSFFKDTVLVNQFRARYQTLRQGMLSDAYLLGLADSLAGNLSVAAARNYEAWPYNGYPMLSWVGNPTSSIDAESDLANLKKWTSARLKWMDDNIGKLYYPLKAVISQEYEMAGGIPCNAWLTDGGNRLAVYSPEETISSVQVVSISGKVAVSADVAARDADISLAGLQSGIYIAVLKLAGGSVQTVNFAR